MKERQEKNKDSGGGRGEKSKRDEAERGGKGSRDESGGWTQRGERLISRGRGSTA